jgi:molybdate transport system substrate-binding protein
LWTGLRAVFPVMYPSRRAVLKLPCLLLAPPALADDKPLLVFAAASLQLPLTRIAALWKEAGQGDVAYSFASSAALAKQIEAGAPADLFASADRRWMDDLVAKQLVQGSGVRTFLGNALVLVAASGNATVLDIKPGFALADAIGDGKLATGTPGAVPLGTYAKEALIALGVWDSLMGKIAGTENARIALALVARGEADFGIVYASDAKSAAGVRVIGQFPAQTHSPIAYPFAVTAASQNARAHAFLDYLSSETALTVFREAGFAILPETQ